MATSPGREQSPVFRFARKRKRSIDFEESPSPAPEIDPVRDASNADCLPDDPPLLENDRVHWEAQRRISPAELLNETTTAQRPHPKRSRTRDQNVNDRLMEMLSLPPSAVEANSEPIAVNSEEVSDSTPRACGEMALVPFDSNACQQLQEDDTPRRKPVSFAKPVDIRVAGSACPWERLPTLKKAHEVSGLATDVIKALCESRSEHLGWECRWPPPESEEMPEQANPEDETCDIRDLAQRIRNVPGAARRRLLAALPASTRGALAEHLKASPLPSPEVKPAKEPDLNDIISRPEVLGQVPQDIRCKVLAGVRSMGARLQAMLVAPDVATIANLIKEALPAHRRTLMEALPKETQEALMEHMLAEKRAASVNAVSRC